MKLSYLLSIFLLAFVSIGSSAQIPQTVEQENAGDIARGYKDTDRAGARCIELAITHYQTAINDRNNRADNYYLAASYEALGKYGHECA